MTRKEQAALVAWLRGPGVVWSAVTEQLEESGSVQTAAAEQAPAQGSLFEAARTDGLDEAARDLEQPVRKLGHSAETGQDARGSEGVDVLGGAYGSHTAADEQAGFDVLVDARLRDVLPVGLSILSALAQLCRSASASVLQPAT